MLTYIRRFTEIDYDTLYNKMFKDKNLFYGLAKGLGLPENIEEIRQKTVKLLSHKTLLYEDALGITFLKIKMAGCDKYKDIKQVIIDEAQDYFPIHFEILRLLFPKVKYTVLGDVNQTIEKQASLAFYESVQKILDKKTSTLIKLSKSFRCTNQIIDFSKKFINKLVLQECFSGDGVAPEILFSNTQADLDKQLNKFVKSLIQQNYKSVCILCKSLKESIELYYRIKDSLDVVIMDDTFIVELIGTLITPIYMAKGLEFDAVKIYNVDDTHYQSDDDKKLLYIASTRALHRLALFYTGTQSCFLIESEKEDAHGDSKNSISAC